MNTIKTISVGLALVLAATSCEDFFDRTPKDEFATTSFFASETDLQLYANGLIEAAMPSVSNLTLGEDAYTDFCGTKQSKAIYTTVYTASTASGWAYSNWSFLRRCVYMLDNMHNAKGKVSDEIYNHYEGVARYWRAYATFNKVKDFGNTYWIETTIQPEDSLKLYGYTNNACTKFLLGGTSESGDNAIDTNFDNLRIYNSRALSDKEVAQIYMSEK